MEDEQRRAAELSEVSMWLYDYDSIFSDFDPRPYSQRALSDDFLTQAKKLSSKIISSEMSYFKILIPTHKRNYELEKTIAKRLRRHFRDHYEISKSQRKKALKKGALFCGIGVLLMLIATLLGYYGQGLVVSFLYVLFEPAGWFLFWEGGYFILDSNEEIGDLKFYKKMSKSNIIFGSYTK